MTNSVINSARNLIERANQESNDNMESKVQFVISELNSMGATPEYINNVIRRLSSFNDDRSLSEAIDRELYKASQFALMEDDEEDATGKGSEDATGKGVKFARPVKTKGNAKKSLDDKQKNRGAKLEHLAALFSGENLTDSFKRKAEAVFEAFRGSRWAYRRRPNPERPPPGGRAEGRRGSAPQPVPRPWRRRLFSTPRSPGKSPIP